MFKDDARAALKMPWPMLFFTNLVSEFPTKVLTPYIGVFIKFEPQSVVLVSDLGLSLESIHCINKAFLIEEFF